MGHKSQLQCAFVFLLPLPRSVIKLTPYQKVTPSQAPTVILQPWHLFIPTLPQLYLGPWALSQPPPHLHSPNPHRGCLTSAPPSNHHTQNLWAWEGQENLQKCFRIKRLSFPPVKESIRNPCLFEEDFKSCSTRKLHIQDFKPKESWFLAFEQSSLFWKLFGRDHPMHSIQEPLGFLQ